MFWSSRYDFLFISLPLTLLGAICSWDKEKIVTASERIELLGEIGWFCGMTLKCLYSFNGDRKVLKRAAGEPPFTNAARGRGVLRAANDLTPSLCGRNTLPERQLPFMLKY